MIQKNSTAAKFNLPWKTFDSWLGNVAKHYGFVLVELQINFCNDGEIQAVNRESLGHDYITDIITFNYSRGKLLRLEEHIGWEEVQRNAFLASVDYQVEFARVLVHGLLHCLGFDDRLAADREEMKAAEEECLNLLPKESINGNS